MSQSTLTINHLVATIKLKNDFPDTLEYIEQIAQKLVDKLDLTVVKTTNHKFNPKGITSVYILSQSHLAIHTWPEYRTIHFDLLSCSDITSEEFSGAMEQIFPEGENIEVKAI